MAGWFDALAGMFGGAAGSAGAAAGASGASAMPTMADAAAGGWMDSLMGNMWASQGGKVSPLGLLGSALMDIGAARSGKTPGAGMQTLMGLTNWQDQQQERAKALQAKESQQSAQAALLGGLDPTTGITWNSGRQGQTPDQMKQLFTRAFPDAAAPALAKSLFPAPLDPKDRYLVSDGRLFDVGAAGGPKLVYDAPSGVVWSGGEGPAGGAMPATPSAPPTAAPAEGGGRVPLGLRNNNPGNIKASDIAWAGEVQGGERGFERFDSPQSGLAAMGKNLLTYQQQHGLNTVEGIVGRWAPPNENNTAAYIATVAKELGVDPRQELNLRDPRVLSSLMGAMVRVENGQQPFDGKTLMNGALMAISGRGAGTAEGQGQQPAATSTPTAGQPAGAPPIALDRKTGLPVTQGLPPGYIWTRGADGQPTLARAPGAPETQTRTLTAAEAEQVGLPPGTVAQIGPDGKMQVVQAAPDRWSANLAGGTQTNERTGRVDALPRQPDQWETVQTPQGLVQVNKATGETKALPQDPGAETLARKRAEAQAQREADAPKTIQQADQMLASIDGTLNHPWLGWGTGVTAASQRIPSSGMYDFGQRVNQLKGQAFLQAFESLKGGGQITEAEGKKATDAIARLDTGQSEASFRQALQDLRSVVVAARERAARQAGSGAPPASDGATPVPADRSTWQQGTVYQTPRGPARWLGDDRWELLGN